MKSQEKFKERVWNATKRIPCGKVSTYAMVAYSIGHAGAARAVGNALNQNCNPEVPCHRVVRSGGFIGGFAHGSIKKVLLLQKEKVKITNNKVDPKHII